MACTVKGETNISKLMLAMLLTITLGGVTACSSAIDNPPALEQNSDLMDMDGDGVINERDLCENSLPDAEVNNDGCAEIIFIAVEDELHILFENNSAKVGSEFMGQVDQLALFMTDFPVTTLILKGYASEVGTLKYNKMLSIKRASEVKDLLVADGIVPERIEIEGYGEENLVMADTEQKSNMLSRRVTASVSVVEESELMEWTIYTSDLDEGM